MTTILLKGYLHSWTYLDETIDPWQAFAGACEGGGTQPAWTQSDDPATAIPPTDAAGSLWRSGDTETVPTTIKEMCDEMSRRFLSAEPVTPVAAYFSSGGRGVFLVSCGVAHYVMIARSSCPSKKIGASELSMCRRACIGLGEVVLCEATCDWCECELPAGTPCYSVSCGWDHKTNLPATLLLCESCNQQNDEANREQLEQAIRPSWLAYNGVNWLGRFYSLDEAIDEACQHENGSVFTNEPFKKVWEQDKDNNDATQ